MKPAGFPLIRRLIAVSLCMAGILSAAVYMGLSFGSTGTAFLSDWIAGRLDETTANIILHIRLPRVILAILVGATLSLGGLVFQALLRNPLAEPYILGISGGSAVGGINGILAGLSRFPGICLCAFAGSMATLAMIMLISSGTSLIKRDSLLLSGVMINSFCTAVIMFLVSMTDDSRLHNIMFWIMGDLSASDLGQTGILAAMLFPVFILHFFLSHTMNLMVFGRETAQTLGVDIRAATLILLVSTSFMVSVTVSFCGLLGFVGLVMPHLLRLILGPDHRILVPACILGGGSYMLFCDLLARVFPQQGEMPTGVITALIGAPLFVFLLKRSG